ncbi:hypothetical protein [Bacillus sp. JCM 19041]|uniref:hypothetical protein n=1 Tax=Bacillus sp. JCM 19041 TaxID=1460637 RepID=UPI00336A16C6
MTETNYVMEPLAFCYETLPNRTLNELMFENMNAPANLFTEEERVFAQGLVDTVAESTVKEARRKARRGEDDLLLPTKSHYFKDLEGVSMAGSSDIGDISYIAPMGQIMTTCYPVGLSVHTWQATASHGSSIGMKGMATAACAMALSLYDLFTKPELVEQAQEEFNQATEGRRYQCAIPDDVKPVTSKQDEPLIMT